MAKKENDIMYPELTKESFTFADRSDFGHDTKFDTKPIGYFKDAFIRFRKNKGSVVAFIIIMMLVLFAIIVPFVASERTSTCRDAYYAKKGPRLTWAYNIGVDGGRNQDDNERTFLNYLSLGVAAEHYCESYEDGLASCVGKNEHVPTLEEGKESYFQPVIKVNKEYDTAQGRDTVRIVESRVDSYLAVGFIYTDLNKTAYDAMRAYEKETGNRIFYPLIDTDSEYCRDASDANYWYKSVSMGKNIGAPLDENDNVVHADNPKFVDIYLRDGDGNPIYYVRTGGGNFETASYHVRVLYYNYYRYLHGEEPNYAFGTDTQGYDLAYRLATGMRLSFLVSITVCAVNFIIGAIYGAVEGYYGGAADLIMERISDILVEVPFVVVATLFNLHLAKQVGPVVSLLFAYVMTGWIGTASLVRTQFYRFKNEEYVLAARTLGARDSRIIWKHIFPNTLGTIITSSVLAIPGVIFSESMLSYLGIISLGTATSTSIGTMLSECEGLWMEFPHLMVFPAIVISLLEICFNLFGNGLRDAFNPTLRGADE